VPAFPLICISAAVEGPSDGAVAERLIREVGATPGQIYIRGGKNELLRRVAAYNNAARFAPWLVLVDLDQDEDCAPSARERWLPAPFARMCFRVAVHAIEAWFLADRDNLARFLRVSLAQVPASPESIIDAKEEIVRIARNSRSGPIRQDIVPRVGSGRSVGPAYVSRLIEFATRHWCPRIAAAVSPSLARALVCLERLHRQTFEA
jgi:hypothetical protein